MTNSTTSSIRIKSFASALLVILALMIVAYVLTLAIPAGSYARIEDAQGNPVVDVTSGFSYKEGGIPFWKWILSPILVLGAEGSGALIAVIAFLLVIGGAIYHYTPFNLKSNCLRALVFPKRKAQSFEWAESV